MTYKSDTQIYKPRSIVIYVFKPLLFLVIFSFTLEVCARTDDAIKYGAPFWTAYNNEGLRNDDKAGFPYNIPNARFEKWQNNSLGFRGPELLQKKPAGNIRVVCLGSSESYGLYESPGKEWPSQLREILSSRYEVINASVVGLNLRSFEPYLKKHVFSLKPDVVILVINPLFYVTSLERAAQSNKEPSQSLQKNNKPEPVSLKGRVLSNSRSIPKMKQVVKQSIGTHYPGALTRYQLRDTQKQVEEIERIRLKGRMPLDEIPEVYLENFRKDLIHTIELIRSQGIEIMLSTYPSLIGPETITKYPEIFMDNRKFCIEFSVNAILDTMIKFNTVVTQIVADKGTLFVNAASSIPKTKEFFADNVHFADKGARAFADSVAYQLQNTPSNMTLTKQNKSH